MNKNKKKAKDLYKKNKKILKEMTFIGVTGTNGKTTITSLLYKYYRFNNQNITLIGTNGIYINDNYYESINTTPGIEKLYDIILKSYNLGIRTIVMEVSSHGIKQYRIHKIKFKVKALTNITLDHLDYHKSFNEYKKVKLSFLKKSILLLNNDIDIIYNKKFKKVFTYGMKESYFNMSEIKINEQGSKFNLMIKNKQYLIETNLLGIFNCYNVLTFIGILYLLNEFDYLKIKQFLDSNIKINGRMEVINYNNKNIIIDYAHTPDGIKNVLSFVKSINKRKIITLFGCGGNRDKSKRAVMGKIASNYSDLIIITSDNPRDEEPEDIIDDIIQGVNTNYLKITDRKKAIKKGVELLNEYDCLLILGRGNESYTIIKNKKIEFNDIEYVKEIINGK